MYGFFGGCTTLFHLAVRYPLLVALLGLGGFAYESKGPDSGGSLGPEVVLRQVQTKLTSDTVSSPTVDVLKTGFGQLKGEPTKEQVAYVVAITCDCAPSLVQDILADEKMRREAAWLLYLDVYSKSGPKEAALIFKKHTVPVLQKK